MEKTSIEWRQWYESVILATGQVIYDWDLKSDITQWSGNLEELLGYTLEEFQLMENPWESSLHRDDRETINKTIREAIEGTVVSLKLEYRLRHKDGSYRDILDRGLIYRDTHGKAINCLGSMSDITVQKKALKELERANNLQTVLYKIANATSTISDINIFYKNVHRCLKKVINTTNFFIGIYDENTNTMSFPYFVDEEDSPPDGPVKMGKTLSGHVINTGEPLFIKEKDIRRFAQEGIIDLDVAGKVSKVWLGYPLKHEDKSVGVIVVQSYNNPDLYTESDMEVLKFVSDQIALAIDFIQSDEAIRESEKMHRQLSIQLEKSNQMKALLLDVITHDLKNPAGVISGMAEILNSESPDDERVVLIKRSSDDLLKVIENASVLSKVTIGEEVEKEERDLADIIFDVIEEFIPIMKNSGMSIEPRLEETLLVKVNPIIAEVFKNYISNALKYARNGERIIIEGLRENNSVVVRVKDFGTTVPEEDREKIFERSIQLGEGEKQGRGLGLAIVKRIAEAHGGEVWMEPNQPQGNIFYLKIPLS